MKRGLYALAGASATATAAACAKRLDAPITKLSKLYLGLSLLSDFRLPAPWSMDETTVVSMYGCSSAASVRSSGSGWISGFTTMAKVDTSKESSRVEIAL